MNESKKKSWPRRVLMEHPAFFLSGIYFVASSIGLVYSWAFLRKFNINVFRYADVSDFILASLKEPFTWFLTLLAVVLIMLDNAVSHRVQRRNPDRLFRWYGSARYRQVNYLGSVVVIIFFLLTYASVKEKDIRDGEGEIVSVYLTDASPARQLVLLGTTGRFVFLFDHVAERVDIHPQENILTITKSSPDSRRSRIDDGAVSGEQ